MLPEWLAAGLWLSGGLAVAIVAIFVAAERRSPTGQCSNATYSSLVSGERRRRIEIRQYLTAIGEEFAEDHPVGGQHVAFYLPRRDVAITFDARAYFRIEKSPTYPVLVEHEMPGAHLGDRLPFETPEIDDSTEVDGVGAAFSILGLQAGATASEIKRAYREKVKDVHPDHGGDRESFQRVREAYATARNHAS